MKHFDWKKDLKKSITEEWRKNNPERLLQYEEKHREKRRVSRLLRKYGITPEQQAALLTSQGNVCAVCKTDNPGGRHGWHTDHCHDTGKVRGMLCHGCNVGLGSFKNNPQALRAAAEYLEQSQ